MYSHSFLLIVFSEASLRVYFILNLNSFTLKQNKRKIFSLRVKISNENATWNIVLIMMREREDYLNQKWILSWNLHYYLHVCLEYNINLMRCSLFFDNKFEYYMYIFVMCIIFNVRNVFEFNILTSFMHGWWCKIWI